MYANILCRVEIAFWELFIDVISRSRYTRSILKAVIQLKRSQKLKSTLSRIALAGMFGLLLGFVVPQFIY